VKIRINNLLPLLMVLFLAGLTLWLRQAIEQPPPEKAAAKRHDPDAIVENFKMVRLGGAGRPQYSMSARKMQHYPGNDITELEKPQFLRRNADGTRYTVTADRGTITADSTEATFTGDVLLRREMANRPVLQARTEYLQVLAEKEIVRTDRHVTIREGNTVFSGVGMEINKRTRQIALMSQVRGSFDDTARQ
jgi:lipopolysaccharide export system protein LptC